MSPFLAGALYAILKDTNSKYSQMDLKEYVNAIDEAALQVIEGKFPTVDDFEKESGTW